MYSTARPPSYVTPFPGLASQAARMNLENIVHRETPRAQSVIWTAKKPPQFFAKLRSKLADWTRTNADARPTENIKQIPG